MNLKATVVLYVYIYLDAIRYSKRILQGNSLTIHLECSK